MDNDNNQKPPRTGDNSRRRRDNNRGNQNGQNRRRDFNQQNQNNRRRGDNQQSQNRPQRSANATRENYRGPRRPNPQNQNRQQQGQPRNNQNREQHRRRKPSLQVATPIGEADANQTRRFKPHQRQRHQPGAENKQNLRRRSRNIQPELREAVQIVEEADLEPDYKVLKVCALGGTEEVGRNCNFIEYGNEIIMIDCGLAFPNSEHYGIDYIIPNIAYLKKKKRNFKGILLTHGHLDHIGALPYIMRDLDFPTIYGSELANDIARARLAEFKMDKLTNFVNVYPGQKIKLGKISATFNHVTHSIPGCYSIFVETPRGNVFVSGDFKIDTHPLIEPEVDYKAHEALRGRVDLALMESTRANTPGHSKTEYELQETLHQLTSTAKGRVIIASFASNISRMYIAGVIAQRTGRKVFVSGRSSLKMLEVAQNEGLLKEVGTLFLPVTDLRKYKDSEVIFLCTGSQGEKFGALNLISLGEHKQFKIKKGDLIVRSSSDIPGNELDIETMTSRLIKLGADLVNNKEVEVHYGGHGSQEDMKRMIELIQPRNVMPVHGHLTLRYFHKQALKNWGFTDQNVLMTDDGAVWSTSNGKSWKRSGQVDAKPVLVDGLGIGDIGDVVLKDREQLSQFGMVVTILNLSSRSKTIIGKPRFVSRGFVYLKTSMDLFEEMEKIVVEEHSKWRQASHKTGKFEYTKLSISVERKLAKFIYQKTEREPMLLTYII